MLIWLHLTQLVYHWMHLTITRSIGGNLVPLIHVTLMLMLLSPIHLIIAIVILLMLMMVCLIVMLTILVFVWSGLMFNFVFIVIIMNYLFILIELIGSYLWLVDLYLEVLIVIDRDVIWIVWFVDLSIWFLTPSTLNNHLIIQFMIHTLATDHLAYSVYFNFIYLNLKLIIRAGVVYLLNSNYILFISYLIKIVTLIFIELNLDCSIVKSITFWVIR